MSEGDIQWGVTGPCMHYVPYSCKYFLFILKWLHTLGEFALSCTPPLMCQHIHVMHSTLNSLSPGKFAWNFRQVIFKQISVINAWGISCEIIPRRMSLDLTDDKATLVQVMAWCRQATSHYLSQCWPRPMSPHGITRPQWVEYDLWSSIYPQMLPLPTERGYRSKIL